MAEMRRVPVPMTADDLAELLTRLAEGVRTGDSLEGSAEWLLTYDDECGCEAAGRRPCRHLMVRAAYRVGNRQGQGGMEMIGEWAEVPESAQTVTDPAGRLTPEFVAALRARYAQAAGADPAERYAAACDLVVQLLWPERYGVDPKDPNWHTSGPARTIAALFCDVLGVDLAGGRPEVSGG